MRTISASHEASSSRWAMKPGWTTLSSQHRGADSLTCNDAKSPLNPRWIKNWRLRWRVSIVRNTSNRIHYLKSLLKSGKSDMWLLPSYGVAECVPAMESGEPRKEYLAIVIGGRWWGLGAGGISNIHFINCLLLVCLIFSTVKLSVWLPLRLLCAW